MADPTLRVSVVTPEKVLLDGTATQVVLRSSDGDLTVLAGHTPLITDIVPGLVRVAIEDGEPVRLAVHGGYLQVEKGVALSDGETPVSRVSVLAGVAELATEIDVARAEAARDAARQQIDELTAAGARAESRGTAGGEEGQGGELSPEAVALGQAEAALRRAEVRLEIAGATV